MPAPVAVKWKWNGQRFPSARSRGLSHPVHVPASRCSSLREKPSHVNSGSVLPSHPADLYEPRAPTDARTSGMSKDVWKFEHVHRGDASSAAIPCTRNSSIPHRRNGCLPCAHRIRFRRVALVAASRLRNLRRLGLSRYRGRRRDPRASLGVRVRPGSESRRP